MVAAAQVVYSLQLGLGAVTAYASYNRYHHNLVRDTGIILATNLVWVVLASLLVLSLLGVTHNLQTINLEQLASSNGRDPTSITGSGLWLAGVTLVEAALASLATGWLWAGLLFLLVLLCSLASLAGLLEVVTSSLVSLRPPLLRYKPVLTFSLLTLLFLVSLVLATGGGVHIYHLLATYIAQVPSYLHYLHYLHNNLAVARPADLPAHLAGGRHLPGAGPGGRAPARHVPGIYTFISTYLHILTCLLISTYLHILTCLLISTYLHISTRQARLHLVATSHLVVLLSTVAPALAASCLCYSLQQLAAYHLAQPLHTFNILLPEWAVTTTTCYITSQSSPRCPLAGPSPCCPPRPSSSGPWSTWSGPTGACPGWRWVTRKYLLKSGKYLTIASISERGGESAEHGAVAPRRPDRAGLWHQAREQHLHRLEGAVSSQHTSQL